YNFNYKNIIKNTFIMNTNKIKKLLSIDNNIEIIGSNANNDMKYETDYDLQEHVKIKNVKDYNKILTKFQHIFKFADSNINIFITDMKAGTFNTLPVRWSYDDIMKGFKIIDTKTIMFVDVMHNNNNTVKIDLIAYINKEFVEFSCNYYFNVRNMQDVHLSLLLDIKKYYHEQKYMKMLKRVMSYRNVEKQSNKELIDFFNSGVGLLYQSYHKIDVILLLLDKFKDDVNMKNVVHAVQQI
ncbi:unnamed protein product, partial [Ectocarpus fasciculatus]